MFTFLEPYILWIKVALVAIFAITVIGSVMWFIHVLNENDDLKAINRHQADQIETAAKLQDYSNKVTEAIGQIKSRSTVNVQRIEAEPKPVFAGTAPFALIPAGMLQAVYSSGHRLGTAPPHERSGSVPPDLPPGGVLPD